MWDFDKFNNNTSIISDNGIKLTYGELSRACAELQNVVGTRCLIFNLCENSIGSLIGYCACLQGRIVPIMLKSSMDTQLFQALYEEYRPQYVWMPAEQAQNFIFDREAVYEQYGYVLLKTTYDDIPQLYEELALLLTTSGSTGSPKFVRQSYKNIQSNTESIVNYLGLNAGERPITTLPMNYTYGLSVINTHLAVGATILLTDKSIMERGFWTFLKENQATSISGVPYTYEMLLRLRFFRMDLPHLKTMTQAGGKLSIELQRSYAQYALENNKNFIIMYGQCEATARMAYLPSEYALEKIGSMGIPIPGGRFELADSDGNIINKPESSGELIYYGDNVTLGYAENIRDLNLGDERKGKLETGDIAYRDHDGFYFISGRKKRFLKLYGNRVNLDEVEILLKNEFADTELAVGGNDDKLIIFITDSAMIEDEMIEFISTVTGIYKAAFTVKYIEKIPYNASGKILYKELEKYFD